MFRKFIWTTTLILGIAASAMAQEPSRFRVDCRYYTGGPRHCYSSAFYQVSGTTVSKIHYGVGCGYQTIYDDRGVRVIETVSDGLRPRKAAIPRIQLTPQDALTVPGSYASILEIGHGRILDGICYVTQVMEPDEYFLNF